MKRSSIGCWPRPTMANNGGGTGWTSCATPTRPAKTPTIRCRMPGAIAIGSSRRSNRDLPYDQFVREQIAGDLLAVDGPPEEYADRVVATGYLAIARRFGHDIEKDMHLTFEDTLDTLGKSILGLSIGCCRCHDHKYDPLTDARLLRPVRHFRQHEVRLSRLRAEAAAARSGAAGAARRSRAARARAAAEQFRRPTAEVERLAAAAIRADRHG